MLFTALLTGTVAKNMYYSKGDTQKAFFPVKMATGIAALSVLSGVSIMVVASFTDLDENPVSDVVLRNAAFEENPPDLVTGFNESTIETVEIVDAFTVIIHSSDGSAISSPAFLNGNGKLLVSDPFTANGSRVTFDEEHGLTAGVATVVSSLTGDYYADVVNIPDQ